jgi:hypothetical protein
MQMGHAYVYDYYSEGCAMTLQSKLKSWIAGFLIERPAKKLTLAQLAASLEASGLQMEQRMVESGDTPSNRERAYHIIGIERWGQRRLQVALGGELIMDRYHEYRPAPDLDWQELRATFRATRQDTIALVERIEKAGVDAVLVPHNDFGDLSVRGWLRYLDYHASLEGKRIK